MGRLERDLKKILLWDKGNAVGNEKIPFINIRNHVKRWILFARPNVTIRYAPVIAYLRKSGIMNRSILEVGSGSVGITRYLNQEVTGVDISFSGPASSHLKQTLASATNLPFDNESFDFVISLDVLEHVPLENRPKIIDEMIRVAKHSVIVGVPCGAEAEKWENRARLKCERKIESCGGNARGRDIAHRSDFLSEHQENGIPKKEEILTAISESCSKNNNAGVCEAVANESNYVWYMLALGSVKISLVRWFLTTLLGTVFMPLLKRISWGGFYRQIYFVEKRMVS
jgi:hypothetical protein